METLMIGEVARQAGVGVETIRFYEREGLVPEPPRTPSGYRQYPEDCASSSGQRSWASRSERSRN